MCRGSARFVSRCRGELSGRSTIPKACSEKSLAAEGNEAGSIPAGLRSVRTPFSQPPSRPLPCPPMLRCLAVCLNKKGTVLNTHQVNFRAC